MSILKPLTLTNTLNNFDFFIDIVGGSVSAQAGAVQHGHGARPAGVQFGTQAGA